MKSRIRYTIANFFWSAFNIIATSILSFITRTVFIYSLGTVYLGVNGLFTNLLGLLSLTDLGIGSAIGFSLYKPLAEEDEDKICRLINFYRVAYRIIAGIIAVVGLALLPFLSYIMKGTDDIKHLTVIYLLYLFNSVSSYLIVYKSVLLDADQKNYIITNVNTITRLVCSLLQIVVLLIFKNFIIYLVVEVICHFVSKICEHYYVLKQYPYLKKNKKLKLEVVERKQIFIKIKGLMFHKFGDIAVNQTDNIITSSVINVTVVGQISNFVMIINFVNNMIMTLFNSAVAGLGNLVATEGNDRREYVFNRYDFLSFWLYGVSSVCMFFLIEPVVNMWLGKEYLVDHMTVVLLCINFYLAGQRVSTGNMRNAAGIYEQDWWSPMIQALLNIGISVFGAYRWGLKGVYVGTIISGMIPSIVRPYMLYKYVFGKGCIKYFQKYLFRIILMLITVGFAMVATSPLNSDTSFLAVFLRFLISLLIANGMFFLAFRKKDEFIYFKVLGWETVGKIIRYLKGKTNSER